MQLRPEGLPQARVGLLVGGASDERAVALDTARCVLRSLRANGDGRGPRSVEVVEWLADGRFVRRSDLEAPASVPGDPDGAPPGKWASALAWLGGCDVVFLALHGGAGEDGTVQGALELAGLPYTGSGVAASALAMDKGHAVAVARALGLGPPEGLVLSRDQWRPDDPALRERLARLGGRGLMVKPNRGGSSLAAAALEVGAPADAAIAAALAHAAEVRIEERVLGLEVTCPVIGEGAAARSLTPVEIVPAEGRYFDFHQKYAADGALERCPPEGLEPGRVERVGELALRAHRGFGCRGLTRVDFICPPDGEPVFLELNTLPGFTERSLAPLSARESGLDHRDLCLLLIEQAIGGPQGRG